MVIVMMVIMFDYDFNDEKGLEAFLTLLCSITNLLEKY